jgi:hypothetical protein
MHKFQKVKHVGYCLAAAYCVYLGNLTFYPKPWLMKFWFLFQAPLKAFTFKGQWTGKISGLLTFWNIIEMFRLLGLLNFIVL